MPFTITITETRAVTKKVGKDWTKVGQKEVDRDPQYYERDANEPKTRITEEYGYTPEVEKTVVETRELLKQEVDTLDLSAVIKAINGL